MPEDKVFLDTNIFIYAYDITALKKHTIAKEIVIDLWQSNLGVISAQVLQEFYVNITKKIPKPLDINMAKEIISDLLTWNVFINDGDSILKAIDIGVQYHYSFWDSMILIAAINSNCKLLISEDLNNGQVIDGVTIKNPF